MIKGIKKEDDQYRDWARANEETLKRQSRSFAIPILNLDDRFRLPVMIEYNLNKTIDTIEDSTAIEAEEKISLISDFCDHLKRGQQSALVRARMLEVTPSDESYVFKNYEHTIGLFNTLPEEAKGLMKKWTEKMAEGMCAYLRKSIDTLQDLNEYCYYVAGTVGLFLTNLLRLNGANVSAGRFNSLEENAVSFGLFLQKLNIIRDYREDRDQKNRSFWPREYFEAVGDRIAVLNRMCDETIRNDAPLAIEYFRHIPEGNASYDFFIRFILYSGIEYIKILRNNSSVFSRLKVKLPSRFIKTLYSRVSAQSRADFLDYCERSLQEL